MGLSVVLQAQVRVVPSLLDLGERGHRERVKTSFEVKNDDQMAIRITGVRPSCSCLSVRPNRFPAPIPPGGSSRIDVTMESGRSVGATLRKRIQVDVERADGQRGTLNCGVVLRVFPDHAVEPREIRLVGSVGGPPATARLEVKSREKRSEGGKLTIRGVKVLGKRPPRGAKWFKAEVAEIEGGYAVSVTVLPGHPEGRIWGELEGELDGRPFVVPVAGDVFKGIVLRPKQFNFSRVVRTDPKTWMETARLESVADRPFKILDTKVRIRKPAGAKFRVKVSAVERREGRVHILTARLESPGQRGSFSGDVIVTTDHPEKPRVTLPFFGFFAEPPKRK